MKYNNYRRDCFWYDEIHDMNATIPSCGYKNTPYECECTLDCPYYISKKVAIKIIRNIIDVINE